METVFIPYRGSQPCSVTINGHEVVILATTDEAFTSVESFPPFDAVLPIEGADTPEQLFSHLSKLGVRRNCAVVIAPAGISIDDLINSLGQELPWIH